MVSSWFMTLHWPACVHLASTQALIMPIIRAWVEASVHYEYEVCGFNWKGRVQIFN